MAVAALTAPSRTGSPRLKDTAQTDVVLSPAFTRHRNPTRCLGPGRFTRDNGPLPLIPVRAGTVIRLLLQGVLRTAIFGQRPGGATAVPASHSGSRSADDWFSGVAALDGISVILGSRRRRPVGGHPARRGSGGFECAPPTFGAVVVYRCYAAHDLIGLIPVQGVARPVVDPDYTATAGLDRTQARARRILGRRWSTGRPESGRAGSRPIAGVPGR